MELQKNVWIKMDRLTANIWNQTVCAERMRT